MHKIEGFVITDYSGERIATVYSESKVSIENGMSLNLKQLEDGSFLLCTTFEDRSSDAWKSLKKFFRWLFKM